LALQIRTLYTTQGKINFVSSKISVGEIYEYALQPEHRASIHPSVFNTTITDTGALAVSSGSKTGRTPKEKRVVLDEVTKDVSTVHFD